MEIKLHKKYYAVLIGYDMRLDALLGANPAQIKQITISQIRNTNGEIFEYGYKEEYYDRFGWIPPNRIFNTKRDALKFKKDYYIQNYVKEPLFRVNYISKRCALRDGTYGKFRDREKLPHGWKPHHVLSYQIARWFESGGVAWTQI